MDRYYNKQILYIFPLSTVNQILEDQFYQNSVSCNFHLYYESQIDILLNHFSQINPKMQTLTISRVAAPIWRTLFLISSVDNKYVSAVISPVLFCRRFCIYRPFSIKNSCGKSSIPRYLNFLINLNNWPVLPDM